MVTLFAVVVSAQTTGKLSGRIVDNQGEALAGATVIVTGTKLGASTDLEGYYNVLNIPAGTYTVRYTYIGFQAKVVENIRINADQTTKIDVELSDDVVISQEVVVVAKRPIVEVNQTSSVSSISKEEIANLPVQDLNEIVNLQAGVVNGHFRGGRIGEVQYQVDGVSVNNPYDNSSTLNLDRSVIQEVQVISGTFDAKYGQAMSGVVNAILRSGSERFEWYFEAFGGDFYTTDATRYPNNDDVKPLTIQNYQATLSGPTGIDKTTFFISGRRYVNDGWLYGERRFNPTDTSDFQLKVYRPTGDNETIAMNTYEEWSGQFKLANSSFDDFQISYQMTYNLNERNPYNHSFRFNPEGTKTSSTTSFTHGFNFTHTISPEMFYKLSLRQNYFDYSDYKYESIYDPRYLVAGQPRGDDNYENGAIIQGVDLGRFVQKTDSYVGKLDYTYQINRSNLVEAGFELQYSEMSFGSPGYITNVIVDGVVKLVPRETLPDVPGIRLYRPRQMAGYLQDRLELGDLVIRAGLRLEYFDAAALMPSDLANPANSITGAPASLPKATTIKYALAPRLGFSFPLTDAASLYFSYGHFYQMPGLGLLYNNADYSILKDLQAGAVNYGVMGNPNLNPEFTAQYEFGLKQALSQNLGVEFSFFYKDIRDLLGVQFIETYTAAEYGQFTNIDFGSVNGITLSLTGREFGPFSATVDYTLQFAQGNSSDPRESANRAAAGKDPRPRDVPFGWDQRHTLNLTSVYFEPDDFSVSAIFRYSSGQPYTPQIGLGFGAELETNSARKDGYFLLDIRAEKYVNFFGVNLSLFARMFNVLNTNFTNGFVFDTTGSPDYTIDPVSSRVQLTNPSRYAEPRRIEIGFSIRSN